MATAIVVVGSINMDLVVHTPRLPVPGETVLGGNLQTSGGGKGANQAVAAARLGSPTVMLGCLGQDSFGDELFAGLENAGVDCSHVKRVPGVNSGVALIGIEDGTRDNFIIASGGANRLLHAADIESHADVITGAAVLVCQLEVPLDAVQAALQLAKQHGTRTILNAAPYCEFPAEWLALVDVLIVNETEAARLSGLPVHELEEIEHASAVLLGRGVGAVVITLGARGAHYVDAHQRAYYPAYPVQPVDTVGAGDAFVGAFAVALAEARDVEETLRFSNAVAALATTRAGAQAAMPTRAEVDAYRQQWE
jgi:ribokinase